MRRMAARSPLCQMPYRSILRVQQNQPDMDGPDRTLAYSPTAAMEFPQTSHLLIMYHFIFSNVGRRTLLL